MKKPLLLSAVALLTFTCFSCSTDDNDSADKTIKVKKEIIPQTPKYASGPGDQPVIVLPPPKYASGPDDKIPPPPPPTE